jgi:hypothetical protein
MCIKHVKVIGTRMAEIIMAKQALARKNRPDICQQSPNEVSREKALAKRGRPHMYQSG